MIQDFNRLAAFLEEGDFPEDSESLFDLLSDGDGLGVLSLGRLARAIPTQHLDYPFSLEKKFLAGFHSGYFRILFSHGLRFNEAGTNLPRTLTRIIEGSLPLCLHGRIILESETGDSTLRFEILPSGSRLRIHFEPFGCGSGSIEIWTDGSLRRSFPMGSGVATPPLEVEVGELMAIRHEGEPSGLGISIVPMEFGWREWRSACINRALSGDIQETIRLLRTELSIEERLKPFCSRLESLLTSVSAVSKTVGGVLEPIPLTRGKPLEVPERAEAYSVVREGLRRTLPGTNEFYGLDSVDYPRADSPKDAERFVHAIEKTVHEGGNPKGIKPPTGGSPVVEEGWASLVGWSHLLEGNYSEASTFFDSVTPSKDDPFSLSVSATLAKHLSLARTGDPREEVPLSSDRVWKEIFSPFLK